MSDSKSRNRALLQEGITMHLAKASEGSAELVRKQIEASNDAAEDSAALACLGAAQAAGGAAQAAVPGAVAIALCSQMALVFSSLETSSDASSLGTAWGMPRALNAGDAFYALAQDSLLSAPDELATAIRLQASTMLNSGARGLVEALFVANSDMAPNQTGQRALLPTALALGGLLGGADAGVVEKLTALGQSWSMLPSDQLAGVLASDPAGWLAT